MVDVLVRKTCWKNRLTGLKAIDVNARIAKGELCPNDGDEIWVENADVRKFEQQAANQCGNCSLCGLKPTENDFEYVDDNS